MNLIQKAVSTVGKLIGAVLGEDVYTPASDAMTDYPAIRYGR